MNNRKLVLSLLSVLLIAVVFSIPYYNKWFTAKFGNEWEMMSWQSAHMSTDERMQTRFGNTILFLNAVKHSLEKYAGANAQVLLPPKAYVNALDAKSHSVDMPEPAVFYYFTGYQGITPTSKDVARANWVIMGRDHELMLFHINTRSMLDSILMEFKPYLDR